MARPYLSKTINELEDIFEQEQSNHGLLQNLLDELTHRKTFRAKKLRTRVTEACNDLEGGKQTNRQMALDIGAGTTTRTKPNAEVRVKNEPSSEAPNDNETAADQPQTRIVDFQPIELDVATEIKNTPEDILSSWIALEVLSPPSYRRPEDLTGGDKYRIAKIDGSALPWEGDGERSRPKNRLYYQVVLGTVELEPAIDALLKVYDDQSIERFPVKGKAVLGVVMVDKNGIILDEDAVNIASFGWGLPKALRGELKSLDQWQNAEKALDEKIEKRCWRTDKDGEPLPLNLQDIQEAYKTLINLLGIPEQLTTPPELIIRTYQYYLNSNPPDAILLNSFYLGDLIRAKSSFNAGTATENLKRYLRVVQPETRYDLLQNDAALNAAVLPKRFPSGRWPGTGRFPLVLLQQAAVNLASEELQNGGILAVNGPPGTGKTTLLRDVLAAVVTDRARQLATYDDPNSAFTHAGQMRSGNSWLHLYKLDQRLRGHEIVVASTNNKAVENISAELPERDKIAEDAEELKYFKTVSDAVLEKDSTWGLIAAVLGNAANVFKFTQTFWWDDDYGLGSYLSAACGAPRYIEETDPETEETTSRLAFVAQTENPPDNPRDALERWKIARRKFQETINRADKAIDAIENIRRLAINLPEIQAKAAEAHRHLSIISGQRENAQEILKKLSMSHSDAERKYKSAQADLEQHLEQRPSFFLRLFWIKKFRVWRDAKNEKSNIYDESLSALNALKERLLAAEIEKSSIVEQHDAASITVTKLQRELTQTDENIRSARERLAERFVDASFFDLPNQEKQLIPPWLDDMTHRLRDDVFIQAMELHRTFIDAAAQKLRHNIGAFIGLLQGRKMPDASKEALVPDLWASFFLAVPLVSTTFASVEKMFSALPDEALGWLFIDEAGQALPQAAIGAIMRTKRAVVVGDPVQIEPVVILPDRLTSTIVRYFGADSDLFNAPFASAQTLADSATSYFAEFPTKTGGREVGVPLLVHRRCSDPMFSISNAIAYANLMVQAKNPKPSPIKEAIGPSRWFHIKGSAQEKWCPEEGAHVVEMLRVLADQGIEPDLYIISPFVIVQNRLRETIRRSGLLEGWVKEPHQWLYERIGTVHVAQGREAQAVIFVLGAQMPQQSGARNWAGGRPNLSNVAVTRAKETFYVVGNRELWKNAGHFQTIANRLQV